MGSGCCGGGESSGQVTYVCAAKPQGCAPKQVPANAPAPTCCGKPMQRQAAGGGCH